MTTATDRFAWLQKRQTGIGSSDAPNLVGVGFRTAADVYREKVEPPSRCDPQGVLARGLALEPIVAALYRDAMAVEFQPLPVLAEDGIVRHAERPWQLATLDRLRVDGIPVELKTAAGFGDDWGESGSDRIPDAYRIQVQHQMGVLGVGSLDLAALDVIAWEFRVYRLGFDRDLFDWLTGIESQFYTCVELRLPLDPNWEMQFKPEAERFIVAPGTRIVLDDAAAEIAERRAELKAIAKEAEAEADHLTAELSALVGDAEQATAGSWKIRRTIKKAHTRAACDVAASTYLDVRRIK